MPSKLLSSRPFRSAALWSVVSLALFVVTWLAVVIWWQITQRVVTPDDAILYLLVLPCALIICASIARHMARRKEGPVIADNQNVTPSSQSADLDQNTRCSTLSVLSVWAATSFANNAEEFVEALAEKRLRPQPDPFLTDQNGFPVLSGRTSSLDIVSVENWLQEALQDGRLPHLVVPGSPRHSTIRALSLLSAVMDQLLSDWPWSDSKDTDSRREQEVTVPMLRGSSGLPSFATLSLHLRIVLLVSEDLASEEQDVARTYVAERLSDLDSNGQSPHLELVPSRDGAAALAIANQFNIDSGRDTIPRALLLLACDSALCPSVVDDWSLKGQLFDSRCPNGLMMGEASFGALFANESAVSAALTVPTCWVTHAGIANREASADAPGNASHECLSRTVATALASGRVNGHAIGTVACDSDHRTNRTLECIGTMMAQTPHLDAIQNRLATNEVCGHLGAASVLGSFVAGVIQSHHASHPVLFFNVSHPTERAAAVLLPVATPSPDMHPTVLQAA